MSVNQRKKTVLITGGSSGIGRVTALKFGSNGYNVCITYNSSLKKAEAVVDTLKKADCSSHIFKADFTKMEDIEKLFLDFDKHYKSLDVLVNNAGWTKYIAHKDLDKLTEDIFDKIIAVDLKAVFFCTKFAKSRI